jgi:hypothetical protein
MCKFCEEYTTTNTNNMDKKVEDFIAQYNQRINWNIEIRKSLDIALLNSNASTSNILDDYLSDEKITPETYAVNLADVFKSSRNNEWSMQIYNIKNNEYHRFWVTFYESKEDYIKERIRLINESLSKMHAEKQETIKALSQDILCIDNFLQHLQVLKMLLQHLQ